MTAIPEDVDMPRPVPPEPNFGEAFDALRASLTDHADSLDPASHERVAVERLWKEVGDAYIRFEEAT